MISCVLEVWIRIFLYSLWIANKVLDLLNLNGRSNRFFKIILELKLINFLLFSYHSRYVKNVTLFLLLMGLYIGSRDDLINL